MADTRRSCKARFADPVCLPVINEPLRILALVARPLDEKGIRWLVGGSVASSLHGVPRSTLDVDLVVDLPERMVAPLAAVWSNDFLVDMDMILDTLHRGGCCNLIHKDSALKVDLFLGIDDPWIRQELDSPDRLRIRVGSFDLEIPFARAEDVLLHKLRWFLDGGSQSDRQWGDVLGIVRARGDDLDRAHLTRWAAHLGISAKLLDIALDSGEKPQGNIP